MLFDLKSLFFGFLYGCFMPRFLLVLVLMPCLNSYADESFSEEDSTSATRFDVLLGPSFGYRSITIFGQTEKVNYSGVSLSAGIF